ncbi:unnamed protein product [Closterium sp. NIES-65]|nr:unnamed protein product [Closterium sp. NIES-65]
MQANLVDCEVYVCIYAKELVASGFANLDDGLPALPYGAGLCQRGMRGDIVKHALKRLLPTLKRAGISVPHQDPLLSKRVNNSVSPEIAELDAKLRDAVGDIYNVTCCMGYCEKDIQKLEFLVESLTNELSTTRNDLAAMQAQFAASPPPAQLQTVGAMGGASARPVDPSTHDDLDTTAHIEQQGDSHQIHAALGVVNGLLLGPTGDASTPTRHGARAGAPSEDQYGSKIVPEPGSSRTLILGNFTDQQQAARAFAAAAAVMRRSKPPRGHVWQLTGEEMNLLDGFTHDIDRQLTTARVWGWWERWRVELASLGGANPAPAPPAIVAAAPTPPGAAPIPLAPANAGTAPRVMALAPAQPTPPLGATAVLVRPTPMPVGLTPGPPAPSTLATMTNPPVQADVVARYNVTTQEPV